MQKKQVIRRTLKWAGIPTGLGLVLWLIGLVGGLTGHLGSAQMNLFFLGYILMITGILLGVITLISLGKR